MSTPNQPAICRLVAHHEGPAAVSQKLGGSPVYQEIQRWVKRGWASPKHIFRLEPLLLEGMTVRDLYEDLPPPRARTSGEGEHAIAAEVTRIFYGATARPKLPSDKPNRSRTREGG
jgi:hypothetical protein